MANSRPARQQAARSPRRKKEEATVMLLETGGVEYIFDIQDISALDERRLELASRPRDADGNPTGERGIQITQEMASGGFSLPLIAGLVYLRASAADPSVTFDQVAATLKLTDMESVKMLTRDELAKRQGSEVDPTDPSR